MIDLKQIEQAANRLNSVIIRTPLISSSHLDNLSKGKVLLKAENLQRTGSFKIRGAYNLLSQLSKDEKNSGAVAYSSGNHAQAVAASGKILNIETTIVMPEDTPQIKVENTKNLGGNVVFYNRYSENREEIANDIAKEKGAVLVPPYNHNEIIAGQGTAGLEIAEQCSELNYKPDQVLVCCSGGGLTAGIATAVKAKYPKSKIFAVEPQDFDDTRRSLLSGNLEVNSQESRTICDALMSAPPGELTFDINRKLLTDVLLVSDSEVEDAIRFAFNYLKLVIEPGGAAALAGALLLGPRLGRFKESGEAAPMEPFASSSIPLATLGVFILWMGWFGFNGGSQLAMGSFDDSTAVATIFINTNLAACAGVMACAVVSRLVTGKTDVVMMLNGALGGLVAITAEPLAPSPFLSLIHI